MNHIIQGLEYLRKGFLLLNVPGIKRYVYIPMLINILVVAGIIYLLALETQSFNIWMNTLLPSWLQWLDWLLWLVFLIAILLFFVYAFVFIANIIAAPFNAFLAEKVQLHLTQQPLPDEGWKGLAASVPRSVFRQCQVILYFLPRAIIFLILFLIPGVNVIASFFWIAFSGWTLAMQYLDYPFDNNKIPFDDMREKMKTQKTVTFSFGMVTLCLSLIPIVNLFVIPAAVAGATALYVETFHD